MTEELLKPAEVCAKLRVSRAWLYKQVQGDLIPHVRLAGPEGPVRFVAEDIEAWIEASRRAWQPGDTSAATLRRAAQTNTT